MQLTINNYRCFPDPRRVRIDLRPGFTAFLGTNNAGKSSLLRFFYEFQGLFGTIQDESALTHALKTSHPFPWNSQGLRHPDDLFCNHNDGGIVIEVLASISPKLGLRLTIPRAQNMFSAAFIEGEKAHRYDPNSPVRVNNRQLFRDDTTTVDFTPIFEGFTDSCAMKVTLLAA